MKIIYLRYISLKIIFKRFINTTLVIMLLCITNIAIAQTTNLVVTESPKFIEVGNITTILCIYTTNDALTGIVRENKRNISFDVFNEKLKKTFSKIIETSRKEKYVGDVFFEDEIKIFTVYSPKKNERIVYCHIFNINTKTYKKVTLFTTLVEKKQRLFSGANKRQTSFAISPNGNFIAISTDNIKKNLNSYTIRVYNANSLDLVYNKSYQEHKEKFFEPNDLVVDNTGTVYTVGKQFLKGRFQKINGIANYDFSLSKITKKENKSLKVSLENDEHISSLKISNIDNLKLLGFYSKKDINRIKGSCSFNIDKGSMSITNKKISKLPVSVYQDLYGYRKAKNKKNKELSRFYIDYVLEDSLGNTFLLAEEFYITQTYVNNGMGAGYWSTVYHFDDILILKYNAKGELEWGRSIFKRATGPSYNAFLKEDKLHVILNSGKKLTKKEDGRTKASIKFFESTALYDFEYSSDGQVAYNKIQNNKGKTFYRPYYGTFRNNMFIMMSFGLIEKQFMILE
jgi:hypothetical protein